jgi:hypothetical protein
MSSLNRRASLWAARPKKPYPLWLCLVCVVSACTGPLQRANQIAEAAGLRTEQLTSSRFQHTAYLRLESDESELWVFVDGDGSPWIDRGRTIAADPTPSNPLALRLAAATPGSVLYLGRPCYFAAHRAKNCEASVWTSGRYSSAVVDSMCEVLSQFLAQHPYRHVILVGYSGGGALVTLVAGKIPAAVSVATVAGNLDIDSWAALHGYSPLSNSLNPALKARLPAAMQQIHLVGEKDTNVPPSAMRAYLSHMPPAAIWNFPDFDHVCCWVQEWPRILPRLRQAFVNYHLR